MFRKILLGVSTLVLGLGAMVVATASTPAPNFSETFDGAPTAPAAVNIPNWDVQVHSRDSGTWYTLEGINAQHGTDCTFPNATHYNDTYEGSVYQCKDHFMTAINAGGYGVLYLTPNQLVDFSGGTATISFDLSTLRMSTRDWVDLWITPYNDNLTLPFDQGDVDLQGLPRNGVHIQMSAFNGQTTFRCNTISNFVETEVPSNWWETWFHSSPTVRDTFKLEISSTHLKFYSPTMTYSDGSPWTACDTAISNLGWTNGVVQFGHHSYNPTKDNSGDPATWHWDNIAISPSQEFTIIKGDRRYIDSSTQTINFTSPALTGSKLRFSANGANVEVSYNGGSTWQTATIQAAEQNVDRFKGYWVDIPTGTQSVKVRGVNTFNGPFIAQDFSIWSLTTGTAGTPTNTAVPTATNTSTNTPTATATSTSTPIPVPTNTPTLTPTSAPTATPTPVRRACRETIRWNGSIISDVNYGNLTQAECQAKVN